MPTSGALVRLPSARFDVFYLEAKSITNMKRSTSPVLVLVLAICALLIAGANQTASARYYYPGQVYASSLAPHGNFIIKHSPTLGINVAVVVTIDGHVAGGITKGHYFNAYLEPGRHFIRVSRNGRYYGDLGAILDVRPGRVYSFVAKDSGNQMVLVPVGSFL